ncbi:MAG TPA: hypothetical protein PK014_13050 [Thermoanaerobaculia bacterium]|nr:hypothetical protein [Thermoanaerobaculia bacterium]HUM31027.1 hypothetical protein [Thermoanaerobaculia bacterium]HXK69325.1 hypothetical protein [Thermoanaerobaculia bacterium]
MSKKIMMTLLVTFLAAAFLVAGDGKVKWLNVDVNEHVEGTKVKVHVPMSLILTALTSVKTEEFDRGMVKMHLDDTDIDLAALLKEIKASPDGEYVKVEDKEANVLISKKGGTIYIDVKETSGEKPETVKVTLPTELLDVIQVTETNELDVKAMLSALEKVGTGEIVTVNSSEADVRVWIE